MRWELGRGEGECGKISGLTDGVRMGMCRFSELANVGIVAVGICKPALSVLKGERESFKANKGKKEENVKNVHRDIYRRGPGASSSSE